MASSSSLPEDQRLFADILRETIHGKPIEKQEDIFQNLNRILRFSSAHLVYPLVVDALYKLSPERMEIHRRAAEKLTVRQAERTASFLLLYRKMQEKGLEPLVMKGITVRNLYPEPELRPSVDEDLLIQAEEIHTYHDFLMKEGYEASGEDISPENDAEITYLNKDSYVCLEVHKVPFASKEEAYGDLNTLFEGRDFIRTDIHGIPVKTFPHTRHFLYLITHAYKHLIYSGIGIRQLCDMVLFLEHYGSFIDWKEISSSCREKHLYTFLEAVLKICIRHLGLDTEKSHIPEELIDTDIDEIPLLEDMISGGIYGANDENRLHSANITLDAVSSVKQGRKKKGLRKALFPSLSYMTKNYPYLKKHKYLLPLAWSQRILRYLRDTDKGKDPEKTLQIGKKRVELLKKYRII